MGDVPRARAGILLGLALGMFAREAGARDRISWGVIDLAEVKDAPRAMARGEVFPVPNSLRIEWTSDTVSMLVYAEAPSGILEIGDVSARPERPNGGTISGGFVLPGADRRVTARSYSFDLGGSATSADVTVLRRRGPDPGSGTLDLNLFVLDGSRLSTNDLNQGLAVFQEVFAKAGIAVGSVNAYNVTSAQEFLSLEVDDDAFLNPAAPIRRLVKSLSSQGPALAFNVFFVRSLGEGLFGISLGLPSALGIPGTISSGLVVSVSAHESAGGFDTRNFGQTIAHETGHNMGLYHTSERDGSQHDTISDTPQCAATGGELSPGGCPDGQNFMFWAGVGFDVSAGQTFVLVRSPIVK